MSSKFRKMLAEDETPTNIQDDLYDCLSEIKSNVQFQMKVVQRVLEFDYDKDTLRETSDELKAKMEEYYNILGSVLS